MFPPKDGIPKSLSSSSAAQGAGDFEKIKTLINQLKGNIGEKYQDARNFKETISYYEQQITQNSKLSFDDFVGALTDAILCDASFDANSQSYIIGFAMSLNTIISSSTLEKEVLKAFSDTMNKTFGTKKIGNVFRYDSKIGVTKLKDTINDTYKRLQSGGTIDWQAYRNSIKAAVYMVLFDKNNEDKKGSLVKLWQDNMSTTFTPSTALPINPYNEVRLILLDIIKDQQIAKKLGYNFLKGEIEGFDAKANFAKNPIEYLSNTDRNQLIGFIKSGVLEKGDFRLPADPSSSSVANQSLSLNPNPNTNPSISKSTSQKSTTSSLMSSLGSASTRLLSDNVQRTVKAIEKIANSGEKSVRDFIDHLYDVLYTKVFSAPQILLGLDEVTRQALIDRKGGTVSSQNSEMGKALKDTDIQMRSLRDYPLSYLAAILQNKNSKMANEDFNWALRTIEELKVPLKFLTIKDEQQFALMNKSPINVQSYTGDVSLYNLKNVISIINQLEKQGGTLSNYEKDFKKNLGAAIEEKGSKILDMIEQMPYKDFNKIMNLVADDGKSVLSEFKLLVRDVNDQKYKEFNRLFGNSSPNEHDTNLKTALVKFSAFKEIEEGKRDLTRDLCEKNALFRAAYNEFKSAQGQASANSSSSTKGSGQGGPTTTPTGTSPPSSSSNEPPAPRGMHFVIDDILSDDTEGNPTEV